MSLTWVPGIFRSINLRGAPVKRIASTDEIGLVWSAIFGSRHRNRAAETDLGAAGAKGVSSCVAELRRRNGNAITDLFGQLRFWARQDRRQNGGVFPESAHLL